MAGISDLAAKAKTAIEAGDIDEGMRLACKALDEDFDDVAALYQVGYLMLQAERPGIAHTIMRRCAELKPERPEVWNNLARCHQECQEPKPAIAYLKQALAMKPDMPYALNNLGLIYINLGDPEKAVALCRKALNLQKDLPDALHNLGIAYLQLGIWHKAWHYYEFSHGKEKSRTERQYAENAGRWDGTKGQTVVAYGEQGIGDEISFASMIPDLIRDCKKVIIDCDPRLKGLFQRSFPEADVYGTRYQPDTPWAKNYPVDAQVIFGSLGGFYRTKESDFPGTPYLVADPERRLQWRALFDTLPGRKIGLCWTGGLLHTGRKRRSFDVECFRSLIEANPNDTFISLQYKETPDVKGLPIKHYARGAQSQDMDDVAAMIAELDCVVTVTSATARFAGALGVKTYVLCSPTVLWFYGLRAKAHNIWHQSIKQFWRHPAETWEKTLRRFTTEFANDNRRNQLH